MTYAQALSAILSGGTATRKQWPQGTCIRWMGHGGGTLDGCPVNPVPVYKDTSGAWNLFWTPTQSDSTATDWTVAP